MMDYGVSMLATEWMHRRCRRRRGREEKPRRGWQSVSAGRYLVMIDGLGIILTLVISDYTSHPS